MLVSSELEAIRKEVLANSSAPSSPNNTNSNTSVPANSNGDTSLTSTNSLAKESAVRVMAMSQQCNGEGGLMCIEAGRQGHESAMKAVPPTHPNFCPAAVVDVNRRQGPGSEAGDASGEERSIARAEALEVALALMQVPCPHTLFVINAFTIFVRCFSSPSPSNCPSPYPRAGTTHCQIPGTRSRRRTRGWHEESLGVGLVGTTPSSSPLTCVSHLLRSIITPNNFIASSA